MSEGRLSKEPLTVEGVEKSEFYLFSKPREMRLESAPLHALHG